MILDFGAKNVNTLGMLGPYICILLLQLTCIIFTEIRESYFSYFGLNGFRVSCSGYREDWLAHSDYSLDECSANL